MSAAEISARSPSVSSTVPDVPTWGYDPEGARGDFARLVPTSPLARKAFSDLIQKLRDQPDWMLHVRQYIKYDSLADGNRDEEDEDGRGTEWYGHYRLNMDIPPKNRKLGWVIGSSRPDLENPVDFLLTPEYGMHGVGGRHARLFHNPDTGVLCIAVTANSVLLNGRDRLRNCLHTVGCRTGILLGDLNYTLEYTNLREEEYRDQLTKAKDEVHQPGRGMPLFLSPTPSRSSYDYGKYIVFDAINGGAFSTVSYGYEKATGNGIVIKRMQRKPSNREILNNEVKILKRVKHDSVCSLVDIIAGDSQLQPPNNNSTGVDELVLVLAPAASSTLAEVIDAPRDVNLLSAIFRHCCDGVAYLHGQGIMHRDIKPDNIGVILTNPPRAVLLDLGSATLNPTSTNHSVGTIRYLAPEVIALKQGLSNAAYNHNVDEWCLGISLYEAFFRKKVTWWGITKDLYDQVKEKIKQTEGQEKGPAQNLVSLMLAFVKWDSRERMSASAASAYWEDDKPKAVLGKRTIVTEFSRKVRNRTISWK